ncbi:adenylate kinase [candidate division KSB1 bacterium 4484_87]|nr:MAG: adenylate kinase [candidate division KSB1 bacterium 4484_87]
MILILVGAPGTGKGTQGKLLAKKYNIPTISTGDILRAAIQEQTELGKKAKSFIDKGELVPDDVMIGIIRERLDADDCTNGFILDGFPRTVKQAEALEKLFEKNHLILDHVIGFDLPEEVIVKRLSSRRVCSKCGKDYNLITNPPPPDMRCEKCGGEIIQRSDDTEETVRNRLRVYAEQTSPLIEFYQSRGKLRKIDADGTIEDIQNKLVEFLENNK